MSSIQVVLEMEGQRLGMEVKSAQGGTVLLVTGILPDGAVAAWNHSNPIAQVCPGDHVVAINDIAGAGQMIEECKAGRKRLVLTIDCSKRTATSSLPSTAAGPPPKTVHAQLDMTTGLKMGIDMDYTSNSSFIIIKDVKRDGAVAQWNLSNPSQAVNAGDRIVSLNGVEGDAKAMINVGSMCFKEKSTITLKVECGQQHRQNLIVTPASAPSAKFEPYGPVELRGVKRPPPAEGNEVDQFIEKWALTRDAAGFLRAQNPAIQEKIMNGFYCEPGHKDHITKFFGFAKRLINANQPHAYLPR